MALMVFGTLTANAATEEKRPNIVIILTDDQGIGTTAPYLQEARANPDFQASTRYAVDQEKALAAARRAMPTLDRLAQQGIVFSNAHVMSPMCAPSRAAILTARYPQRFGIYSNYDISRGLSQDEYVLINDFQNAGYRTGAFGKWHLAKTSTVEIKPHPSRDYHDYLVSHGDEGYLPTDRGFDEFFGYHLSGASLYGSPALFRGDARVPAEGCLTDQISNETIAFIKQTPKTKPFLAYVAYNVPHIPLEQAMPERYRKPFSTGNPEVDNYFSSLAAVDEGLHRIVDAPEGERSIR